MKKSNLLITLVLLLSTFMSCSEDENLTLEDNSVAFKTYELKRNASGEYSIDINVEDNVSIDKVKNTTNNTNEFYLSSTSLLSKEQDYSSDLMFDNENFKIEFIVENSRKTPSISIVDDNILYTAKTSDEFLKEYSISKNEEGLYDLDFTVRNKVSVDFIYDEETDIYEIHLEETEKSQESNSYFRTFENEGLLQIDFVNHSSYNAKSEMESFTERKPRIIIDEGEDL
ncbi:hypothetical protein [Polaribacter sargassicola]|uniref:hypothetical protein n=1 Tax=Polaribacter sargassicola TaxID=2836891 RepID=UPI001F2052FE|nr:hypothetical protein [Polaribacter sp. DS7-9]MCG1035964.1 hypothetical protein [Polaribacter sp. DS7-9]